MEKSKLRGLIVDGMVGHLCSLDWGPPQQVESFARDFYSDKISLADDTDLPDFSYTLWRNLDVYLRTTKPLIDILVDVLGAGLE